LLGFRLEQHISLQVLRGENLSPCQRAEHAAPTWRASALLSLQPPEEKTRPEPGHCDWRADSTSQGTEPKPKADGRNPLTHFPRVKKDHGVTLAAWLGCCEALWTPYCVHFFVRRSSPSSLPRHRPFDARSSVTTALHSNSCPRFHCNPIGQTLPLYSKSVSVGVRWVSFASAEATR
jgi:hypothetical protein